MAGRSKPRSGIFVGGPRDAVRAVLQTHQVGPLGSRATFTRRTRVSPFYAVTTEQRPSGLYEAAA